MLKEKRIFKTFMIFIFLDLQQEFSYVLWSGLHFIYCLNNYFSSKFPQSGFFNCMVLNTPEDGKFEQRAISSRRPSSALRQ